MSNRRTRLNRGKKRLVGKIRLTPTWQAVMPSMIAVLEEGSYEGKQEVKGELMRLARKMDEINAMKIQVKKDAKKNKA